MAAAARFFGAGGFIVQLMPNAEEEVIEKLEKNLAQITSVTELLDQGYTPEMLLEKLLGDMDLEINEKVPTSFYCNCDKVRVGKVLISLGEKELQGMIDDGENIELNCHFCNTNYTFSVEELKKIPCKIGVASGLEKKEALHAALLGEYINILYADEELGKELIAI